VIGIIVGECDFACFKPSLYDRMTSFRFIKTVGELVEFHERYMSELADDVGQRIAVGLGIEQRWAIYQMDLLSAIEGICQVFFTLERLN